MSLAKRIFIVALFSVACLPNQNTREMHPLQNKVSIFTQVLSKDSQVLGFHLQVIYDLHRDKLARYEELYGKRYHLVSKELVRREAIVVTRSIVQKYSLRDFLKWENKTGKFSVIAEEIRYKLRIALKEKVLQLQSFSIEKIDFPSSRSSR